MAGGVVHLTVVSSAAQQEIQFIGKLGQLQRTGVASTMIWKMTEAAGAAPIWD